MDHLIDEFDVHIEWSFRYFKEQWESGKYSKWSECPSYKELRTILDSVNILRTYMGWNRLSIKEMIEYGL